LEEAVMRNALVSIVVVVAVVVFASGLLTAAEITVSPHVINIGSETEVVTVHTDLPYSSVLGATVTLNGIEIDWWKSDNRGNFVAKFDADVVKGKVETGTATLTLAGETVAGPFSGTDTVEVIDIVPKKK
jgi:hypothetical protein